MTDAHSVLSKALVLHLFALIFLKSSLTSSSHLNLGLTHSLPHPDLPSSNFFTGLSPFILTTFPGHSNLHTFITAAVFGDVICYKFVDSFLFSRALKCDLGKLLNSYHDMCLYIVCGQVCCSICFQFLWILWLLSYLEFVFCERCPGGFSGRIQKCNTDFFFYKISLQLPHSILVFNN